MSSYDAFAAHYDAWAPADAEDVAFYVDQALIAGSPVVELGVGTGRVAIPTALAGIRVIGVDASQAMLDVCRRNVEKAGVAALVDLRLGDFRSPPVSETVPLVTCPIRSFLHLESDEDRRLALTAIREILRPGGRFVFDVVAPRGDPVSRPDTGWIERGPGVLEKDEFDWEARLFRVRLRTATGETELRFAWIEREEWRRVLGECGFRIEACYGWFDRTPCGAGAHSVWVAQRPW